MASRATARVVTVMATPPPILTRVPAPFAVLLLGKIGGRKFTPCKTSQFKKPAICRLRTANAWPKISRVSWTDARRRSGTFVMRSLTLRLMRLSITYATAANEDCPRYQYPCSSQHKEQEDRLTKPDSGGTDHGQPAGEFHLKQIRKPWRQESTTARRPDVSGRNKTAPACSPAGNRRTFAMPLSRVNRMRSEARAASTTAGSFAPRSPSPRTVSASCPGWRRSSASSVGRFSSILKSFRSKQDQTFFVRELRRVSERRIQMLSPERGIAAQDLFSGRTLGEIIENDGYRNPSSRGADLTAADPGLLPRKSCQAIMPSFYAPPTGETSGGVALTTRKDSRAISHSSSVCTTSTRTAESGAAISASGGDCAFFAASSWTPRNAKDSTAWARTCGEFSPTPAVKTSASRPPRLASMAPISERKRCTYTSNASCARTSPRSRAARTARMSPETPETPRSPDSLFSTRSSSSALSPRWRTR